MISWHRALVAAAIATTLVVVSSGCSGSGDDKKDGKGKRADKATYLTGFGVAGRDAFAWVAKDKGFFKEANLDVTIQPGSAASENLKALAANQAQFVAIDLIGGMVLAGKGEYKDFRAIAALHQQNLVSIVTLEGNGITAPKDLEGKKVGAATGSVNHLLFPAYANLTGIDVNKVTIVNSQPAQLPTMLASGAVSALSTFLIGQKGIEKVANKKAIVLPYSDYLRDLYGTAMVTSTKIAKDNPALARRFRDAMLKAYKYSLDHAEESAQIMKKANPTADIAAAVGEINLMRPYAGTGSGIGAIEKQRVAQSIATLQGAGLIPAGLTPDSIVDFSLVPKD
jgi:NitT/TauT family transport system substrate-binding protein